MRIAFLLGLLAVSLFYTYIAFANLAFLSSAGRLGPGFFPRILGVLLVVTCLASLWHDRRRMDEDEGLSPYWGITLVIALLSAGLVVLFGILGGILAIAVYLLVALTLLNRGQPVLNVAVALLLPAGIYLLFDLWLNASMPRGVVPLPI